MTGNDMLSMLGIRLEDPDEKNFTQSLKLDALNLAQKTVVNLIDNAYLTELEILDTAIAVTANVVNFTADGTDLTKVPIRNGILVVKDVQADKYCSLIEARDIKRTENSYLAGNADNPIAYIFAESIRFLTGTITSADVWYLKEPTDLAADGVDCELNVALHELVVDFAESHLWKADAKVERSQAAVTSALLIIQALNDRYQTEKPRGVGTEGRQRRFGRASRE